MDSGLFAAERAVIGVNGMAKVRPGDSTLMLLGRLSLTAPKLGLGFAVCRAGLGSAR